MPYLLSFFLGPYHSIRSLNTNQTTIHTLYTLLCRPSTVHRLRYLDIPLPVLAASSLGTSPHRLRLGLEVDFFGFPWMDRSISYENHDDPDWNACSVLNPHESGASWQGTICSTAIQYSRGYPTTPTTVRPGNPAGSGREGFPSSRHRQPRSRGPERESQPLHCSTVESRTQRHSSWRHRPTAAANATDIAYTLPSTTARRVPAAQ